MSRNAAMSVERLTGAAESGRLLAGYIFCTARARGLKETWGGMAVSRGG